jgi:fatty-acyl-CoA synthase
MGFSARDTILPMTPMFHANGAWGFTHAAPMVGAKLVLPGPKLDAVSIAELIAGEGVTVTAGVPTLYSNLLRHMEEGSGAGALERIVVAGSAPAPSMIEGFERLGVSVNHVWGHDETSPCGTSPQPSRRTAALSAREQLQRKTGQGQPIYGVDVKIADELGNEMPRDGKSSGRFMVRGPWIVSGYYGEEKPLLEDGWFNTGDLAVMDDDKNIHPHRPRQGCHQVGRRVDQFDRYREPCHGMPGGCGSGRDRGFRIRNGKSARFWWWYLRQVRPSACSRRVLYSTARSPSGGCRTTSSSSTP